MPAFLCFSQVTMLRQPPPKKLLQEFSMAKETEIISVLCCRHNFAKNTVFRGSKLEGSVVCSLQDLLSLRPPLHPGMWFQGSTLMHSKTLMLEDLTLADLSINVSTVVLYSGSKRGLNLNHHLVREESFTTCVVKAASVNNGGGPPVFKISGQVCHRIGSLLPPGDASPKFSQLYVYDTSNELANRFGAVVPEGGGTDGMCPNIGAGLMAMLDEVNPLVQQFRIARDRLAEHGNEEIGIRIVGASENDPVQYEMPTASELAALIVGDFTQENYKRDIIVHGKDGTLHRVSCLHPAYMPLQYPLLFPYGERGYQLGIRYQGMDISDQKCRMKVTMQDYYCYRCHYRMDEPNPFLCYGRLSEQAKVDGYACVEESRLKYINDHQDELRCDYFQGIVDAVGKGTLDGASIGKKKFLPASFTGGKRYMAQNYQDALAICRVHRCPDWFVTFTANPKWREVIESLDTEPGQQPCDRSDVIVRIYKIKLDEMLDDIKDGTAFGPVLAVLQSTEFQKRGLPHAHILVWLQKDGREGIQFLHMDSCMSQYLELHPRKG